VECGGHAAALSTAAMPRLHGGMAAVGNISGGMAAALHVRRVFKLRKKNM